MDSLCALLFTLVAGLLLLATGALFTRRNSFNDGAPSVTATEYLPGGKIFEMRTNPTRAQYMMYDIIAQYGRCFFPRLGPTLTLLTAYQAMHCTSQQR